MQQSFFFFCKNSNNTCICTLHIAKITALSVCYQKVPLGKVSEYFREICCIVTLNNSSDQNVWEARAYIQSGHKWRAKETVLEAESRLHHKNIVETTCKGRQGLGTESLRWTGASTRKRRELQKKIRQKETIFVKAVEMGN